MTDRAAFENLINEFEAAYEQLVATAEHYPEDLQTKVGVCGDWSAREILAHLAGWIAEALRRCPRYAIGTGDMQYNTDAFNAVSVWSRDGKLYDEIVDEVRDVSAQLATYARGLSENEIARNGERYAEWLTNLAREARDHTTELEDFNT